MNSLSRRESRRPTSTDVDREQRIADGYLRLLARILAPTTPRPDKPRVRRKQPTAPWHVYCVGARGIPVLYIGITINPKRRFAQHRYWFFDAPRPLTFRVHPDPLSFQDALQLERVLHRKYPHARTRPEARAWMQATRADRLAKAGTTA